MDRANQLKTVLGADCELSGELTLENDALIMGTFEGRLYVSGALDLNRTSRIKGTIVAGSLRIGGRVEADIIVNDKLELLEGAVVIGRVFSPSLRVTSGGVIRGQVCVGPNASEEAQKYMAETGATMYVKPAAKSQATPAPVIEAVDAVASHDEATEAEEIAPNARTMPDSIKAVLERRQPVKTLRPNKKADGAPAETVDVEQAA